MASAQDAPPTLEESRQGYAQMEVQGMASLAPPPAGIEESWITIPTPSGWESPCKVVRPKGGAEASAGPLVVYFYGGGFVMGTPDQMTRPAREWAETFGATVVLPSYRFAPECPWPASSRDGWDVVAYLAKHAESDEKRFGKVSLDHGFIVGGASAGGNIAAVVAGIAAQLESGQQVEWATKLAKPLTGAFIVIPVLVTEENLPPKYKELWTSREDYGEGQGINKKSLEVMFERLQCSDYHSPWFSPIATLNGPKAQGLIHPPTYIQVGHSDPLRDDGFVYSASLKELPGMQEKVKIDRFPDDGHAGISILALPNNSKNPSILEATMDGMKWLLEKK